MSPLQFALVDKRGNMSYDATVTNNRRKAPVVRLQSEDRELTSHQRGQLVTGGRDIRRNFSICAWAIRRHIDYVASFTFQSRTGDDDLDKLIEKLVRDAARKGNFEVGGRHSLNRYLRLTEGQRVVDGDVFTARYKNGQVQGIEADRVREPQSFPADSGYKRGDFPNGIQINKWGRPQQICICRRGSSLNSFSFETAFPARHVFQLAYFDRLDQLRGISPLAPAINTYRDAYEGMDYALAKMKVAQMFGLALFRDADDEEEVEEGEGGESGSSSASLKDFGKAPIFLDLPADAKAEFLESKSPSTEFQSFMQVAINSALKALDLPYSFFDESWTNYGGQRSAILQYENSADSKREDNVEFLDWWTLWRLSLMLDDGELVLPSGWALEDLAWEWMSTGVPWLDPLKEITGDLAAVKGRLNSRTRICRTRGLDFRTIVDEISGEETYMKEKGVTPEQIEIVLTQAMDQPEPPPRKGK